MSNTSDLDPIETQEWQDALDSVIAREGVERAHFLLERMIAQSRQAGVNLPYLATTAYINTIPVEQQAALPGDADLEQQLRAMVRWNAAAMVLKANQRDSSLGGHISSFASSATLYDVGFTHFFHAPTDDHGGDLLFIQGHSAPGIYSRAFLEGRLSEEQLDNFRRDTSDKGLPSYPHPWLMPDFWQFPTVSMGLGPICAIYQARFLKYLQHRGMAKTDNRQVWAFLGDGETDEPESLGAIALAGREKLGNLNFIINCNLQRLDGPVRGNSKIIQELEGVFHGAGWNVIKVVWGSQWDPLLAQDHHGKLKELMMEVIDGEYQNYKAKGGKYTREHFFNRYEETKKMVAHLSDEDIGQMNRGGHDPHKVYAAYHAATQSTEQPTVILAKTVKGYGMGESGEGTNAIHSQKKMEIESLKKMRNRFRIPLDDQQVEDLEYIKPDPEHPAIQYMHQQRKKLGGYMPQRKKFAAPLETPALDAFQSLLESSGKREISTTMAFVRILTALTKDKKIGKNIVPIVPDEARTFGMEGMFRQLGIYSSVGQLYEPQDRDEIMYYKEDKSGQILEEGINEAGAMSSWIAAATAYSTHGVNMVPFYIYYSMFGFQRVGDLAWLAGDMSARGFLIGGTAGRTTLNGEGLQHEDGHSHIQANTIPNCVSYDPCYSYELAVIVQNGLKRMYEEQENIFYYITTMNENYSHPAMPEGCEEGIVKGLYQLSAGTRSDKHVCLLGSGTILREVEKAAVLLKSDWDVSAEVWSVTSFNELTRDGQAVERWNLLNSEKPQKSAYVTHALRDANGPVVAASDYMKNHAEQIRAWVPGSYKVLGTDGFGRSDTRAALRDFFEVDARYIVVAALRSLADEGTLEMKAVSEAVRKYGLDPDKKNPISV